MGQSQVPLGKSGQLCWLSERPEHNDVYNWQLDYYKSAGSDDDNGEFDCVGNTFMTLKKAVESQMADVLGPFDLRMDVSITRTT
jgi:hypothetical protein